MTSVIQEQTRLCDGGVKHKVFICSLPSSKPALLISGILCLDEFQAQNLSTILSHQYVKKDHIPFLSRGMSWLLLGDGSHPGLEYRQEEKRRRVIQGLLS